jgi:hypothetical protein
MMMLDGLEKIITFYIIVILAIGLALGWMIFA